MELAIKESNKKADKVELELLRLDNIGHLHKVMLSPKSTTLSLEQQQYEISSSTRGNSRLLHCRLNRSSIQSRC